MRIILCLMVGVLLIAPVVSAEVSVTQQILLSKYDLDSTDYIYCKMSDLQPGLGRIETDGSNATVTALSGDSSFSALAVGDEVVANNQNLTAPVTFTIIARASATSVTADQAVNIDVTGASAFQWRDLTCGTTASDGWFRLPPGRTTGSIIYRQGDLEGGVTFIVEGRNRGSYGVPSQLVTGVLATESATLNSDNTFIIGEDFQEYRVGIKATTSDPGDAGANIEQVGVEFTTVRY
jgi:hypothetical protein